MADPSSIDSPSAGPSSSTKSLQKPRLFSLPSAMSALPLRQASSSQSGIQTPVSSIPDETTALLADRDVESGSAAQGLPTSAPTSRPPSLRASRIDRKKLHKRAKYYIPSMAWIPEYSISLLAGDMLGGFTIACMLIPQSISYASSLAKLSPVTGLFSASIPPIFYALLGTSRQLNVAPEAALSLLVGQAISQALIGDPHETPENPEAIALAVSTVITLQAGLFSFLLGFFRLGFIDVVLSRALLRGYITAVAVIIFIEQFIPLFGLVPLEHILKPSTTVQKFTFLVENVIPHMHVPTTLIGFGALLILVLMRSFKRMFPKYWFIYRMPEVLIVVLVSMVLSDELGWDKMDVQILGDVKVNLGSSFIQLPFRHFNLRFLRQTTPTAGLIAVMGFLDSIVAAKQNGALYGHSISPNRELVALGVSNIAGSFIPGTLPAYGSITRSRVNGDVGARTQMASLICAGLVLLATFFLLPWMYYLPKAVLASVICLIVFSLLAELPHDLIFYWKMGAWTDLALITLTFVLAIVESLEVGIITSMLISLLLVVHRSSKTRLTILGRIPGTDRWRPIGEDPDAQEDIPGALIVRVRDNLDFANTAQLKERLRRLELYGPERIHPSEDPRRQQANVLVFHMADVETCDASAIQILGELLETYRNRGVTIFVTHLRAAPRRMFQKAGIVEMIGEEAFYDNVAEAISRLSLAPQ